MGGVLKCRKIKLRRQKIIFYGMMSPAIKDDNCCFIILKSMLELESDGADSVNDAEIVDILGEFNDRELSGKVILELKYGDETKDEQNCKWRCLF